MGGAGGYERIDSVLAQGEQLAVGDCGYRGGNEWLCHFLAVMNAFQEG